VVAGTELCKIKVTGRSVVKETPLLPLATNKRLYSLIQGHFVGALV